jgi:hypothetical protein
MITQSICQQPLRSSPCYWTFAAKRKTSSLRSRARLGPSTMRNSLAWSLRLEKFGRKRRVPSSRPHPSNRERGRVRTMVDLFPWIMAEALVDIPGSSGTERRDRSFSYRGCVGDLGNDPRITGETWCLLDDSPDEAMEELAERARRIHDLRG